jgi:cellobiose phosphorylase
MPLPQPGRLRIAVFQDMLKECSQLAQEYGRTEEAQTWRREYDRFKSEINRNEWDGEWYVRAFADGQPELVPIGTSKDREGQIYLLPQVWAVISGVADSQGAQVCMKPVEKYLVSEFGPMLFAPPYSKFDPHVGTQLEYAPGWRNSCIYPRPAGWAIIRACLVDLPDLAFEMYKRTSLSERSKDVERYQNEPYAYSENYVGRAHRLAGLTQFQWNLGEGTNWMWHSYVYYILGIRPVFPGLLVDPKIPKDWPRFRIVRPFRNARYENTVSNPIGMHSGVNALEIDGKHIKGNIIPSYSDEKTHYVEAVLDTLNPRSRCV